MHTNRITVSLAAMFMVCSLVLEGFSSPAAAKTIVVTTLIDTADPPFKADGVCGTGSISDLPGTDGQISLREAIIAANNTPGADMITFAPNLSGGTLIVTFDDLDADLTPNPLPALCGGYTRINGDLNDDDVPDITLEGAAFPVAAPPAVAAAAGISVLSSHNTINGLQVQHFPFGIRVRAGDFINSGTVTHTMVTHNILAESTLDGILVATGNVPDSLVAHTTIADNLVLRNARFGIAVLASLSGAGSDSQIDHTTITDNEVTENGNLGVILFSLGDNNVITDATIARNTVSDNVREGITVFGGVAGADGNTVDVRIRDNMVTDNRLNGIRVVGSQEDSSNNHVTARIEGNTLERNQPVGIIIHGGQGAFVFPTGTSNHNVVDVRIKRNTLKSQMVGMYISAGDGSQDGRAEAVADNNQVSAIVRHNVIEGSTLRGVRLAAGGSGLASANTLDVQVEQNTICNNGTDILGEGGSSEDDVFAHVPNMGTGNLLQGRIFKNTATTVSVEDGILGNTADVTQFKNEPCP